MNRNFLVWDLDLVFSMKLLSCVKQRTAQPGILMFQVTKKKYFPPRKRKGEVENELVFFFFNVLIFIYLAVLDLSCSMQDLVPLPEIEPGPSASGT